MSATTPTEREEPTRPSPEVIFVPPPDRPAVRPFLIVLCTVVFSAVGVGMLFVFLARGQGSVVAVSGSALFIGAGVLVGVLMWRLNRLQARRRRAFLEQHPPDDSDPRVEALAAAWAKPGRRSRIGMVRAQNQPEALPRAKRSLGLKRPSLLPNLDEVRAVLAETKHDDPPRGAIICFGEPEVPKVGQVHFEPEIVTPTRSLWKQLPWMLLAGVIAAWWLIDYLGWLPARVPSVRAFLGGFLYFIVAGVIVLFSWVWRSAIRPRYIRMAPGIIQVLEYRYAKSKPTIRSYPMEAGTLAMFVRLNRRLVLTLSRDGNKDMLPLSQMRRPDEIVERTWQALLSTAPTPPLSDVELVG